MVKPRILYFGASKNINIHNFLGFQIPMELKFIKAASKLRSKITFSKNAHIWSSIWELSPVSKDEW